MSVQSDVHEFLTTVAKGTTNGHFIPMDPGRVAEQVGTTRNKVNKTLFNLTQSGKIELERGPNGRTITGFKLLQEPADNRRKPGVVRKIGRQRLAQPAVLMPDQARRRRPLPTPHLDEYESGKEKFERLQAELGDLIDAQFRANPYAEEGLMLRDRLASVEAHYAEVMRENESMSRDLRALRGRVEREIASNVARGEQANAGDG